MEKEVNLFPNGISAVPALSESALKALADGRWSRFFKDRDNIRSLEESGPLFHGVSQSLSDLAKEIR